MNLCRYCHIYRRWLLERYFSNGVQRIFSGFKKHHFPFCWGSDRTEWSFKCFGQWYSFDNIELKIEHSTSKCMRFFSVCQSLLPSKPASMIMFVSDKIPSSTLNAVANSIHIPSVVALSENSGWWWNFANQIKAEFHVYRLLGTTLANAHIIRPGVFELQLLIYVLGEIMNETK